MCGKSNVYTYNKNSIFLILLYLNTLVINTHKIFQQKYRPKEKIGPRGQGHTYKNANHNQLHVHPLFARLRSIELAKFFEPTLIERERESVLPHQTKDMFSDIF